MPRPGSPISWPRRRGTRLPKRHWSGCRACPSGAGTEAVERPSGKMPRHEEAAQTRCGASVPALSPAICASIRKASHIGADMNHLWPVSRYSPSPAGSADVVLARTSVPPCFSVMPMPMVTPAFAHRRALRRIVLARADQRQPFARHAPATPHQRRNGGVGHGHRAQMAAFDAGGQIEPRSPRQIAHPALARGRSSQIEQCRPSEMLSAHQRVIGRMEFDHVEPVRPCVVRTASCGTLRLARRARSKVSGSAHQPPWSAMPLRHRAEAARPGGAAEDRPPRHCCPSNGGDWLKTA